MAESIHQVRRRSLLFAAFVLLLFVREKPVLAAPPRGNWVLEDGSTTVEIGPCGERICGRIIGVTASDSQAVVTPDGQRIAPGASREPLCGQTVMEGFRSAGNGIYRDGRIFNPSDDRWYSATLTVENPDTLRIHAYVGIEAFGQTQRLYRVGPNANLRGADQCSRRPP
jgi:uncharacterized protein (DUF2147 family)